MEQFEHGLEVLSAGECRRLLERTRVGRIALCDGETAMVFPVNYGVVGGEIVLFTGQGTQIAGAAAARRRVSFQIDEVDLAQESGWSVLVVGTATVGGPGLRQRAEAIGVCPWAGGQRHVVVDIRPDAVTGRRIPLGRQVLGDRRRGPDRRQVHTASGGEECTSCPTGSLPDESDESHESLERRGAR